MKHILFNILLIILALVTSACNAGKQTTADANDTIYVPTFCTDTAMASINKQCDFGPRTLGSKAHEDCAQYIIEAFKQQGCEVTRQDAEFTFYNGEKYKGCNIIATTNPQATDRIMVCTHWDSRPWADNDPDPKNHRTPVLAANDGASGVGVMIELARTLKAHPANVGVDFVCFDAEDAGVPDWDEDNYQGDTEATWCLGSQYWAANPHNSDIRFAILLDMVGGKGATFYREGFSRQYAESVQSLVWAAAAEAGYGSLFVNDDGGAITDDHLPINRIAGIPAIDIIPYYPNLRPGFCPTWHTISDTPQNIDPNSLQAVGQTLLQVIYTF